MCIRPKHPMTGQIIHLPPARPASLVAALRRRDINRNLAFLAAMSSDDDPTPSSPAAAMRRAA